jgi:hypothetical protein
MSKGGLVKQWSAHGLRCAVWLTDMGHYCGYVGVASEHPLYGKEYSDHIPGLSKKEWAKDKPIGDRGVVTLFLAAGDSDEVELDLYFDVHGSLTYSGQGGKYPTDETDLWFFGFDCAHCDDTPQIWNEKKVTDETEKLAAQLAEFVTTNKAEAGVTA